MTEIPKPEQHKVIIKESKQSKKLNFLLTFYSGVNLDLLNFFNEDYFFRQNDAFWIDFIKLRNNFMLSYYEREITLHISIRDLKYNINYISFLIIKNIYLRIFSAGPSIKCLLSKVILSLYPITLITDLIDSLESSIMIFLLILSNV